MRTPEKIEVTKEEIVEDISNKKKHSVTEQVFRKTQKFMEDSRVAHLGQICFFPKGALE